MIKLGKKVEAKEYLNSALKILEKESLDYVEDKIYFKKLYLKNVSRLNKNN